MLNDKPTIVFDVDDTISTNFRRLSYDKCIPITGVINKLNYLHDTLGYKIVLYTARGMVSCNGDVTKIIQKNKVVLEEWLKQNNVHYDELYFGKPLGDMYVDDKAMNVDTFLKSDFYEVQGGGSGGKITRLGYLVKKDLKTESECNMFKDWIDDNKGLCNYPKVFSYLYNYVYMYYIDGTNLSNFYVTTSKLNKLVKIIEGFSGEKMKTFDLSYHIDSLLKNAGINNDFDEVVEFVATELIANESEIKKYASFSHGDFILSNIIETEDKKLYFIDQRYNKDSSTFLFDFAKLRMSIKGYEYNFKISDKKQSSLLVGDLDVYLKKHKILKLVLLLELMFVCRLYRYKNEDEKQIVSRMALEVKGEYEKLSKA